MLFALHLVHSGRISPAQLVEALTLQVESRPQVGRLACKSGKLTMKQVFAVLQAQANQPARFGETAVQLGFLKKGQVNYLLRRQRELTPSLTECLVNIGAIDQLDLESELSSFRQCPVDLGDTPPVTVPPLGNTAGVVASSTVLS